jgi:hypothetical protein
MHWDLSYDSWEDFSSSQKYFATGEAIAHLDHLISRGEIKRIQNGSQTIYKLTNKAP